VREISKLLGRFFGIWKNIFNELDISRIVKFIGLTIITDVGTLRQTVTEKYARLRPWLQFM
jgi:hypothetical protein